MPISSLIVQARNGRGEAVAERLKTFPELEVTAEQGDHLVVVTESKDRRHDRDIHDRIKATDEVIALSLIYANFEDLED